MKKSSVIFIILILTLFITSCGNLPNASTPTATATNTPEPPTETPTEEPTEVMIDTETPTPEPTPTEIPTEEPHSDILVLYFDYSENMGDTTGWSLDAITSASLDNVHPDGVTVGNLLVIKDEIIAQTGADVFPIHINETHDPAYRTMVGIAQQDQNTNRQFTFTEDIENLSEYQTVFIGMPVWWSKLPQPVRVFMTTHDFSGKTIIPFGIHLGSGWGQMLNELAELAPNASLDWYGYTTSAYTPNATVRGEVDTWLRGKSLQTN